MNKFLKSICALSVATGMAACGSTNEPSAAPAETPAETATSALMDGVYEAKASGYGGELNLKVTVKDGALSDLELGDNHETSVVIDRAFPVIKERILNAQTPVVDSVSAATFSSYAVKSAVADAIAQAGGSVEEITMTTTGPVKEAVTLEDTTCDIVVVGGGPSGLAAAITAKQTNPDANVLLIEKFDILSGNGKFDMNYYDLINSEAQKANGETEWTENQVENFIEDMKDAGDGEARLEVWANEENVMDAWLRDQGVELNYNYGSTNHMAEADQYAGEVIQAGLEKTAKELGIDIRTGTKGEDLIMDNGSCLGVSVTNNQNESYNIMASKTILATGGFCSNKDLLAKYAPGYEALGTSNQMGTTGDFVPVFEKNGFSLKNMDVVRVFPDTIVPRRDLTNGADLMLLVNKEGERFANDKIAGLDRFNAISEQTDGAAFLLTDTTGYNSFYRIRKHVDLGYYTTADTLEELGEALGIDGAKLQETVDAWNAAFEAGTEDELTGKVPSRAIDAEGPYYAVRTIPADHMTKGGVETNEHAQVLMEDGTVVNNLYASGEVTWQSGGYSQSVCFGRVAGREAAETLGE